MDIQPRLLSSVEVNPLVEVLSVARETVELGLTTLVPCLIEFLAFRIGLPLLNCHSDSHGRHKEVRIQILIG